MGRVPIRVALVGARDIVDSGLRSILAEDPDIEVMDRFPTSSTPDVIVYDAVAVEKDGGAELAALLRLHGSKIVVVGRDLRPDLAARAMAAGADGVVSLEAPGADVLELLHAAVAGDLDPRSFQTPGPGAEIGLTPREVDVVSLVARGHTNLEIADALGLSQNSVKSYIRSAYRKMGATNRAQAVAWCARHGFEL